MEFCDLGRVLPRVPRGEGLAMDVIISLCFLLGSWDPASWRSDMREFVIIPPLDESEAFLESAGLCFRFHPFKISD